MGDSTRIREVDNAKNALLSHVNGDGNQVVQHSHRVWHIDHLGVLADLSDEAARGEVIGDWHPHAQGEHIGIRSEQLLHHALGLGIERSCEVGFVVLKEAYASA